jgi:hypothetical protein
MIKPRVRFMLELWKLIIWHEVVVNKRRCVGFARLR